MKIFTKNSVSSLANNKKKVAHATLNVKLIQMKSYCKTQINNKYVWLEMCLKWGKFKKKNLYSYMRQSKRQALEYDYVYYHPFSQ